MTEKELRKIINESMLDKQLGITFWPSWSVWDNHAEEMIKDQNICNQITSSLLKNENSVVSVIWNGFEMPPIITVPAKKADKNFYFFEEVLNICNTKFLNGPVTAFPSMKELQMS